MNNSKDLRRIGVFYDGNYFLHVSNYYNYFHQRRKRINIAGLHDFIRNFVAKEEEVPVRFCQVIEAHYFRGRISAQEASQRGNQYTTTGYSTISSCPKGSHPLPANPYP